MSRNHTIFQILKTLPLIYLLLSLLFLAILSNSYPNSQSDNMYFPQTSKCQKLTFLVCGVDLDYKWHHSVRLSCDKVLISVWLWNILVDEEIASNWRIFSPSFGGEKDNFTIMRKYIISYGQTVTVAQFPWRAMSPLRRIKWITNSTHLFSLV